VVELERALNPAFQEAAKVFAGQEPFQFARHFVVRDRTARTAGRPETRFDLISLYFVFHLVQEPLSAHFHVLESHHWRALPSGLFFDPLPNPPPDKEWDFRNRFLCFVIPLHIRRRRVNFDRYLKISTDFNNVIDLGQFLLNVLLKRLRRLRAQIGVAATSFFRFGRQA